MLRDDAPGWVRKLNVDMNDVLDNSGKYPDGWKKLAEQILEHLSAGHYAPLPITERPDPIAVCIASNEGGQEFHMIGVNGVTAMVWGQINGPMAPIATIQVFKGDRLYAEAPFINCESVRYFEDVPA